MGFTDHQLNLQVLIIFLDLVPRCPHPPVVSWIAPDTTALPNTSGPENANSHSAHLEILELLGNVLSIPVLLKSPRMGAQLCLPSEGRHAPQAARASALSHPSPPAALTSANWTPKWPPGDWPEGHCNPNSRPILKLDVYC